MNNYLWIIMPGPRNYAAKSTSYYSWLAHYYLQSSHKLCRWLFPNAQQALDLTQTKVVMGTVYSENSALSAFPVSQLKKREGQTFISGSVQLKIRPRNSIMFKPLLKYFVMSWQKWNCYFYLSFLALVSFFCSYFRIFTVVQSEVIYQTWRPITSFAAQRGPEKSSRKRLKAFELKDKIVSGTPGFFIVSIWRIEQTFSSLRDFCFKQFLFRSFF